MHPWVKGIQVCLNEGPNPFPRGDCYKISENTLTKLKKSLLQNCSANFNQFWHEASLGEDANEKTISYHKVNIFFSSLNQRYDIIICVNWFELFSQVSDVAHEPLVLNFTKHFQSLSSHKPWYKANFFISEPVLFGTWDGVFTSCLINILGVVIFLRMGWIVVS